jgi:hypothetical protein
MNTIQDELIGYSVSKYRPKAKRDLGRSRRDGWIYDIFCSSNGRKDVDDKDEEAIIIRPLNDMINCRLNDFVHENCLCTISLPSM